MNRYRGNDTTHKGNIGNSSGDTKSFKFARPYGGGEDMRLVVTAITTRKLVYSNKFLMMRAKLVTKSGFLLQKIIVVTENEFLVTITKTRY